MSVAKCLQYTNNNLRFISLLCIRKTKIELEAQNPKNLLELLEMEMGGK